MDERIASCSIRPVAPDFAANHKLALVAARETVKPDKVERAIFVCGNAWTDSVPTLTNDVRYEYVFIEQLGNSAEPADAVFAVSGSGNSPNLLRAIEFANSVLPNQCTHGARWRKPRTARRTIARAGREYAWKSIENPTRRPAGSPQVEQKWARELQSGQRNPASAYRFHRIQ